MLAMKRFLNMTLINLCRCLPAPILSIMLSLSIRCNLFMLIRFSSEQAQTAALRIFKKPQQSLKGKKWRRGPDFLLLQDPGKYFWMECQMEHFKYLRGPVGLLPDQAAEHVLVCTKVFLETEKYAFQPRTEILKAGWVTPMPIFILPVQQLQQHLPVQGKSLIPENLCNQERT